MSRILRIGDANPEQNSTSVTPKNIVVDRCIISGHDALHCRVGIGFQCDNSYVIDSDVNGIHAVNEGDCQAFISFNSNGTIAVINTYLEASSENWALGGGDNFVGKTENVEFQWVRCSKPVKWFRDEGTYIGFQWELKNLGEIKKVHKMLINGLVAQHSKPQAQVGYGLLFKDQYTEVRAGTRPTS
jgi:hypothetical protein